MSIAYGQQALTPGTPTVYNVPMNSSAVVVQNESPYTLNCAIDGTGNSKTIAAQSIDMVAIPTGSPFSGNIILTPLVVLDNSSQAPSYAVLLDAYGQSEAPAGTYPVALNRLVQVGGTVNTAMGGATNLQNDNNPANTSVVEATVSGSPQSNVALDNSGNLTLRQYIAGTLTTLLQIIAGATAGTSNVLLGDAGHQIEVMGNLKVDGTTFMGTTQIFGPLQLKTGSSIQLFSGSLTRIGIFNGYFNGSASATITHNWGVAPDVVIPFYSNWTTPIPPSNPNQPIVYSSSTTTTSTVLGDSTYHFQVLLIKF